MAKVMIASVYDAFRAANVPDEKARAASEDLAEYDHRLEGFERPIDRLDSKVEALRSEMRSDFILVKWMIGANSALAVAVLVRLFVQ